MKRRKIIIFCVILSQIVMFSGCESRRKETTENFSVKAGDKWQKKPAIYNFAERINFASFDQGGLFIDFGTTDYFKYTLGGWNTGWGKNGKDGNITYTEVTGNLSQIKFSRPGGDVVLNLRFLPQKADSVVVYVNNHPLEKIRFQKNGWQTRSLKISKEMFAAGENKLFFRWFRNGWIYPEEIAAFVDYAHLQETKNLEKVLLTQESVAPDNSTLVFHPDFSLSYYLEIPKSELAPELGFYFQNEKIVSTARCRKTDMMGNLKIELSADNSENVQLLDEPIYCGESAARSIDLSNAAGKIVLLKISFNAVGGKPPHQLTNWWGGKASGFGLKIKDAAIYVSEKKLARLPKTEKPIAKNVIVILADTLRADHLGAYGNQKMKTPVFDKIAEEGVLFKRFSAVEDWTKPTVATVLTGVYPATHKAQTERVILSENLKLISEEMSERGFETAAFIANSYISEGFGFKRGWDYYENFITENKPSEADSVFGSAAKWIEENKDKRFFIYIHTIDPHSPYSPPDLFLKMYDEEPYDGPIKPEITHIQVENIKQRKLSVDERDIERLVALYDGEISFHDVYLGLFMQRLDDLGLLRDTMVIVTADHGEEFSEHGNFGHGHSLFPELTHIPFVVYWQGVAPKGKRIERNCDQTVIFPTILDAVGFGAPDYLEGISVLPEILGASSFDKNEGWPVAGFSVHEDYKMAVRSGDLQLEIDRGRFKFFYNLCDLGTDPLCQQNLAKSHLIESQYLEMLLAQFVGAGDKKNWKSREFSEKPKISIELKEVRWDDELLRQLGED